jgi:hypothetical protein
MPKAKKVTQTQTEHGTKITKTLRVKEINVSLNKNSKHTIVCEPSVQNPTGVFQFSHKNLNRLAEKCGAVHGRMLRNACASGMTDDFLNIQFTWCEKGELVLDDNGETILDTDTGKERVFKTSHWSNGEENFILGVDGVKYIANLNMKSDLMDIRTHTANQDAMISGSIDAPAVEETDAVPMDDIDF